MDRDKKGGQTKFRVPDMRLNKERNEKWKWMKINQGQDGQNDLKNHQKRGLPSR